MFSVSGSCKHREKNLIANTWIRLITFKLHHRKLEKAEPELTDDNAVIMLSLNKQWQHDIAEWSEVENEIKSSR